MTRDTPRFPPDVAAALQERSGSVSVRYTVGGIVARRRDTELLVMQSYDRMLAALTVDTRGRLKFIRTGDADGAKIAMVDVRHLLREGAHWDIALTWTPDDLSVTVADRDDPDVPAVTGAWPRRA